MTLNDFLPGASFSSYDFFIIVFVAAYSLLGFFNGFLNGTIRLLALAAMALSFTHGAEYVIGRYGISLGIDPKAEKIAIALALAVPIYLASLVLRMLVVVVPDNNFGKALGVLVGFVRGNVTVTILVFFATFLAGDLFDSAKANSFLLPQYERVSAWIADDVVGELPEQFMLGKEFAEIEETGEKAKTRSSEIDELLDIMKTDRKDLAEEAEQGTKK